MQLQLNGKCRDVAAGLSTLADLLGDLGLAGKRIAVERNGEIVPKSRYEQTPLEVGDRIEIVGAVGGG